MGYVTYICFLVLKFRSRTRRSFEPNEIVVFNQKNKNYCWESKQPRRSTAIVETHKKRCIAAVAIVRRIFFNGTSYAWVFPPSSTRRAHNAFSFPWDFSRFCFNVCYCRDFSRPTSRRIFIVQWTRAKGNKSIIEIYRIFFLVLWTILRTFLTRRLSRFSFSSSISRTCHLSRCPPQRRRSTELRCLLPLTFFVTTVVVL